MTRKERNGLHFTNNAGPLIKVQTTKKKEKKNYPMSASTLKSLHERIFVGLWWRRVKCARPFQTSQHIERDAY
jgi:hypothetical protein